MMSQVRFHEYQSPDDAPMAQGAALRERPPLRLKHDFLAPASNDITGCLIASRAHD